MEFFKNNNLLQNWYNIIYYFILNYSLNYILKDFFYT